VNLEELCEQVATACRVLGSGGGGRPGAAGLPGHRPRSGGAAVLGLGVGGGDGGQVDLGDAWPGAELIA